MLVRYLGSELYGVFQYVQNWYVTFTPLTLLGIGAILSREVGKNRDSGQNIISTTFIIRLLFSIALMGAALTAGYLIEPEEDIRKLMIIFSFLILGRAMVNWVKEVFIAYQCTKYHLVQVTTSNLLQALIGLTVMYMGGDIFDLAATYMLLLFLEFIVSFIFICKFVVPFKFYITIEKTAKILKQGIPIGIAVALNRWMLFGPVVVCRYILEYKADLGQVAVVMLIVFFTSLVIDSFLHAALPVLSKIFSKESKRAHSFISTTIKGSLPICTIIGISGMTFGPEFIQLLFGDEYILAGELLGPALWLLIPYVWITALSQTFILRENVTILSFNMSLGAVWMTGLLAPMAMYFDMIGIIYAVGIGMAISLIGLTVSAIKLGQFHPERLLRLGVTTAISIVIYFTLMYFNQTIAYLVAVAILLPDLLQVIRNISKNMKRAKQR
jgi:PST family polysaccharide transporter